jgi:hypothetical protein
LQPPTELIVALATQSADVAPVPRLISAERWAQLRALDRFVLMQLAQRGKTARLFAAYDEIVAPRSTLE